MIGLLGREGLAARLCIDGHCDQLIFAKRRYSIIDGELVRVI